nr:hypothetical protein Itr_chr03CG13590 [Ipomoea trifida]
MYLILFQLCYHAIFLCQLVIKNPLRLYINGIGYRGFLLLLRSKECFILNDYVIIQPSFVFENYHHVLISQINEFDS